MSKLTDVCLMKGTAVTRIETDMIKEHIGSATFISKHLTRMLEMMTPTLPRASAKMCKYTPVRFSF